MIKVTRNTAEATAITHSGKFHADEVMATVILSKLFEKITVLRTFKVPEGLPSDVIVYDIGGSELDHHQRGGNGSRENGVPYAAAGLVWSKYGRQIVAHTANPNQVFDLIDRDLIQGIDAVDNGVMPRADYPAQSLSISQAIASFNPSWDCNENSDTAFLKAVSFAEVIFENILENASSKANAQSIVDEAIDVSTTHIMVLEKFVPWQEFIFSSHHPKAKEIYFVIFPSNRGGYNWQCVPDAPGGYGQRKPVPSEWKGLTGAELQKVSGVKTATFCHQAGFIGSAETLGDAIEMAKIAIKEVK